MYMTSNDLYVLLFYHGVTNDVKMNTVIKKIKSDESRRHKENQNISRALNRIFSKINGCKGIHHGSNMIFFEIYSKQTFNLLSKDNNASHHKIDTDKSL